MQSAGGGQLHRSLCSDVCVAAGCKRDAGIGMHGKEGPVLHQKKESGDRAHGYP